MKHLGIYIDDGTYLSFQNAVGKGKVAKALREYMENYSRGENLEEEAIRKKYYHIKSNYEQVKNEYDFYKAKVEALEAHKKAAELEALEQEAKIKEQWSQVEYDATKKSVRRIPL